MKEKKKIKEMNINNKEVTLSQIADETWLCLYGSEKTLVFFVFVFGKYTSHLYEWPLLASRPMLAIIISVTTDEHDLVWSSAYKWFRAVTGQTLLLLIFSNDFDSFSMTEI